MTANALIARGSGAILNPNLESLFQGVKLRQFPFTFEFFPRNPTEAEQVKMIIRVLKRSMSAKNNKDKGRGVFIKQPDIFQLRYMKGASEHPFLNKFLPMHLTDMKINQLAQDVEKIAQMADPLNQELEKWSNSTNGLQFSKVSVPIGVIGIIYESRPNVTIDAASLCLRSGNVSILRGGSECIETNRKLYECIQEAL